jgi:hypothetical protein
MIFGAQLGDTFSTLRLEVDVVGADYRESVHPVGWRLSRAASRFGKRGPHQPAGCAAKAWATHKASNTFRTQVGIRGQLLRSPLSLSLADAGPAIAQSIHVQRVSRCSLWQAARASAARMRPQAFRVAASQRGKAAAATPTTSTLPAVGVYTVRTVAELTQRVVAAKDFDVILLGAGTYKDGNDLRIK